MYAKTTTVSVDRSQQAIRKILLKFGADKFGCIEDSCQAQVAFDIGGKRIRLYLVLPDRNDPKFCFTSHHNPRKRTADQAFEAWEQECRRLWRSLTAIVKAKVIAVEDGISTIEREFLADLVLPEGRTVEEVLMPKIAKAYIEGKTPPLLTDGK